MQVAVVGSGPAGATAAVLLARRGHRVTLVDRDPGPPEVSDWERVGVMQFHLPHSFRAPGRNVLLDRLPEVHQGLLEVGGRVTIPPGAPDFAAGLQVRRAPFERILWETASTEPGVARLTGHADAVALEGDRVLGVVVDGERLSAELVIDASGKSGHLSAAYRPDAEGGDCGFSYASRVYRLHPGAGPGPINGGPGYLAEHHGFLNMVFHHEAGYFSVLVVRASKDQELAALRDTAAFEAAMGFLPVPAQWTDPTRSSPVDKVRAGAGLVNRYRSQARGVTGLLAIGDSLCATNPAGARGLSLGLQTAAAVTDLVDESPPEDWAGSLDDWAEEHLRPWYVEHVRSDALMLTRWSGEPLDGEMDVLPASLIAAAAQERPELLDVCMPYLAMLCLPTRLDPLREQVRDMIRAGWRPIVQSPSRDELVHALARMSAPAAH